MRKVKFYSLVFLAIAAISAVKTNSQTTKQSGFFSFINVAETSSFLNPPSVVSITRASSNPARWQHTINFTVTFSESVTGVDIGDFTSGSFIFTNTF